MRRTAATFVALTTVTLAIWSGPASATIPLAPIEGTKYPEWIAGTRHDDTIRARGGGDEVDARRGDDFVTGGRGNDVLHGRRGSDVLQDRHGRNELYGGKGHDVLRVSSDHAKDRYDCGPGWDVLAYGGRPDQRDAVTDCERIVVNVGRDWVLVRMQPLRGDSRPPNEHRR